MRIRNSGSLSTAHRAPGQPELVCVGLPVPSRPKHFTLCYIFVTLSLSLSLSVGVCMLYAGVYMCAQYRDQNLTFSIFLYHFLPYFWRQNLELRLASEL